MVVITRGTDAHGHLPAAVAGNIYRALSPRFGTQINFQVAEGPDDETPNGARDKKAAALNEEAKETKATEAEENADESAETMNSVNAKPNAVNLPAAEKSKVKATSMPLENKPKPAVKTPVKPGANETNDGRPRRIQPDQE